MEYNFIRKTVPTLGLLLDTVSEQPVDTDLTLPDYCPDIERILKCVIVPKVYLSNLSGDRLTVEGGALLRVIYLDSERGCPHTFEYTAPFSESFPLKDSPDDYAVYVDTKPEYLNCRAMSPRKLSLHGAFSLYVRVAVQKDLDYYTYEDDDDLQVLSDTVSASALCGLCSDTFSIREDIPVNSNTQVASILSHRVTARIKELKAIHHKIMLTAEGKLELMYLSDIDSRDIACMSYSFPISQVIDCSGVEEDSVIDARLDILTYDLHLSDDALDGSSVLGLDVKLCFNALCFEERDISVVSDAFSTARDIEPRYSNLSCCGGTTCLRFNDIKKAQISVDGESISKVIDVHPERIAVSAAVSGGAPMLSAKATVTMLFENADGELRYIDRDIDFDYNPDVDGFDSVDSVRAAVESLSYRILDENTVELRAEICYELTVSRRLSHNAVCAASADDDTPERGEAGALILYYADEGESVWDISKRFYSRPSDIMAENALDSDTLDESLMLLIP